VSHADTFRALAVMCEAPTVEHEPIAHALGLTLPSRAEHTEVFSLQVYPYASVYLGAEGMLGGEARDRVAGFWRAIGLVPPAEPDHLAALLGLHATLIDADAPLHARTALLWEHLLTWIPVMADTVVRTISGTYTQWAAQLLDVLLEEAAAHPLEGPAPLHFRMAPPLPDFDRDPKGAVNGLLAPVRTGMVLTRADLATAAEAMGLGLRQGERRFVLSALLAQDARSTFAWLADHAGASAERIRKLETTLDVIARFWVERADAAAGLLQRCSAAAEEVVASAARG
jgi:Nitrate reductase delta subunit